MHCRDSKNMITQTMTLQLFLQKSFKITPMHNNREMRMREEKNACCQVISIKSQHITFLKGHVLRPYILYEIAN